MKRSGTADLPLHGGRVPRWLAERMTELGTAIVEQVVLAYGPSEFLTRISDPFWFQALGAVMGMDWHSSGITTSVMGALKRGSIRASPILDLPSAEGGAGIQNAPPDELRDFSTRTGLNGDQLVRTSRLTARVDNNAIADGFQHYQHSFVIHKSGEWAVVQQGMNDANHLARRYHWHSTTVRDFVSDPHSAILGQSQGIILNLVDTRADIAQRALITIVHEPVEASLAEARRLVMPSHHDVRGSDVDLKRLGGVLAVAYEQGLRDFASLLLVEGLGPRTLQSLALIAEVVHGAPSRFSDPARFSFAHGGKDGHPFPVPLKTYDDSLGVLRRSLDAARLGHAEKIEGFRRLDRLARAAEQQREPLADFAAAVAHERAISPSLGGRTVFDGPRRASKTAQLSLFDK